MATPLDEQIRRLRGESARRTKQRQNDTRYSRLGRMREDIANSGTFLGQVAAGVGWIWGRALWPMLWWARRPSGWLVRQYKRLWGLAVYRRTSDQVLVFSKTRAGLFILATWFVAWYVALPVADAVWDGALYMVTAQHDEHVYLLGSQEIDSWTGSHVVDGCSKLPCSDQDAIYFRTVGGLFNNLWSLAHHGGLFYPEYVGAAVPYSTSKCVITSYGVRIRLAFRLLHTYSYLLAVTCTPTGTGAAPVPR